MGPRSLLLGPGVHPEEGSISACCPRGRGWGAPEAQLGRGCTDAAHGLGAARGTQRTHWKQSWGTRWPEGGEETPTRRPPTPARVGRPRQGLTALHYPADLAGINLTIYTHANQL